MRFRRSVLAIVLFVTALAFLGASPPADAVTTFCYTWSGTYIFCRICEFYGPNGEYLGFIDTCWERQF